MIHVWNVLCVYLKFCDIKSSVLSVSPLTSAVWHFFPFVLHSHYSSLIHVNFNSHLTDFFPPFFFLHFSQHASLVLSLLNFIRLGGFNFKGVLNQTLATNFICELKEPPAGHVFHCFCNVNGKLLFFAFVGHIKSPPSRGSCLFIKVIFIFGFNGFPSETITLTLMRFKWDSISKLMWPKLFQRADESTSLHILNLASIDINVHQFVASV